MDYEKQFNLQPQYAGYLPKKEMLMIDSSNYSYIFLDSYQNAGPSQNNSQLIQSQIFNSQMTKNFRIGVDEIFIFDDLWNVNPYNDKLILINTFGTFNITLTNGRYKLKAPNTDPASLSLLIQNAFNAVSASIYVCNVVDGQFSISSNNTFAINYPNERFAYYGSKLHGLRAQNYNAISTYFFTPPFCYTNLIYFRSDIQRFNKNDEDGFDNRTEIISSVILDNSWLSKDTTTKTTDIKHIKYFCTNETISMGSFAIQLFDDYGLPLFIQPESNFRYIVRLIVKNIPN